MILFLSILSSASLYASESGELICSNPTKSKIFKIGRETIAMKKALKDRTPSNQLEVRIAPNSKKVNKTFFKAGLRYELFVKNRFNPSAIDDYIWITDRRGNKILYPLECEII